MSRSLPLVLPFGGLSVTMTQPSDALDLPYDVENALASDAGMWIALERSSAVGGSPASVQPATPLEYGAIRVLRYTWAVPVPSHSGDDARVTLTLYPEQMNTWATRYGTAEPTIAILEAVTATMRITFSLPPGGLCGFYLHVATRPAQNAVTRPTRALLHSGNGISFITDEDGIDGPVGLVRRVADVTRTSPHLSHYRRLVDDYCRNESA
jgi:hypothetical protein